MVRMLKALDEAFSPKIGTYCETCYGTCCRICVFKRKTRIKIRGSEAFALNLHEIPIRWKPKGKREGVDFMEMGVYLAPVFDMS